MVTLTGHQILPSPVIYADCRHPGAILMPGDIITILIQSSFLLMFVVAISHDELASLVTVFCSSQCSKLPVFLLWRHGDIGGCQAQVPGHQGVSAGCCCSWSEPQDWALLAPSAQPSVVCVGRVLVIPLTSSI